MIDEKIIERVENYWDKNYIPPKPTGAKFSIGRSDSDLVDKYEGFTGSIRWKIDKLFDKLEVEGNFGQYLLNLIHSKGLNEVEVYKKANIHRRIFSKLRRYKDYTPIERTIWAIAFSMELSLSEAEDLLKQGGYAFSDHNKEDLIIKFFFENRIYDLFTINEILDYYGYPILGG